MRAVFHDKIFIVNVRNAGNSLAIISIYIVRAAEHIVTTNRCHRHIQTCRAKRWQAIGAPHQSVGRVYYCFDKILRAPYGATHLLNKLNWRGATWESRDEAKKNNQLKPNRVGWNGVQSFRFASFFSILKFHVNHGAGTWSLVVVFNTACRTDRTRTLSSSHFSISNVIDDDVDKWNEMD